MKQKQWLGSTGHGTGVTDRADLHEVLSRDRFWMRYKKAVRLKRRREHTDPALRGLHFSKTDLAGEWEKWMRANWPDIFRKTERRRVYDEVGGVPSAGLLAKVGEKIAALLGRKKAATA